jgi:hypothetical protein
MRQFLQMSSRLALKAGSLERFSGCYVSRLSRNEFSFEHRCWSSVDVPLSIYQRQCRFRHSYRTMMLLKLADVECRM